MVAQSQTWLQRLSSSSSSSRWVISFLPRSKRTFKPTFSLYSFTFIKRLFSSSSLSAIRVVSAAYLRWWNFSWAISNPKRWSCESDAFNMPAKLKNSAVATGLEKVSFHSNPKKRQCQRMFKLLHNCTHSHASKVMLKILQARLQQYVNWEL